MSQEYIWNIAGSAFLVLAAGFWALHEIQEQRKKKESWNWFARMVSTLYESSYILLYKIVLKYIIYIPSKLNLLHSTIRQNTDTKIRYLMILAQVVLIYFGISEYFHCIHGTNIFVSYAVIPLLGVAFIVATILAINYEQANRDNIHSVFYAMVATFMTIGILVYYILGPAIVLVTISEIFQAYILPMKIFGFVVLLMFIVYSTLMFAPIVINIESVWSLFASCNVAMYSSFIWTLIILSICKSYSLSNPVEPSVLVLMVNLLCDSISILITLFVIRRIYSELVEAVKHTGQRYGDTTISKYTFIIKYIALDIAFALVLAEISLLICGKISGYELSIYDSISILIPIKAELNIESISTLFFLAHSTMIPTILVFAAIVLTYLWRLTINTIERFLFPSQKVAEKPYSVFARVVLFIAAAAFFAGKICTMNDDSSATAGKKPEALSGELILREEMDSNHS